MAVYHGRLDVSSICTKFLSSTNNVNRSPLNATLYAPGYPRTSFGPVMGMLPHDFEEPRGFFGVSFRIMGRV